jgi:hypothetical protein
MRFCGLLRKGRGTTWIYEWWPANLFVITAQSKFDILTPSLYREEGHIGRDEKIN